MLAAAQEALGILIALRQSTESASLQNNEDLGSAASRRKKRKGEGSIEPAERPKKAKTYVLYFLYICKNK